MPEKLKQIVAAIKTLNPETDFTGTGKPKVEALEAVLGFDVSGEGRDAAWQVCQETNTPAADEAPAVAPKKDGPVTIADAVKAKRTQGMKI